jgi:hypothetical protein
MYVQSGYFRLIIARLFVMDAGHKPIAAWAETRPLIQTLRLAVENHRA